MYTTYIRDAGIAVIPISIIEQTANIKWMLRVTPVEMEDSGWRVLSDRDTGETMRDRSNFVRADFNILCNIEPACIGIYDLPIGSDIQLVVEPDGRRRWFDNKAREEIRLR